VVVEDFATTLSPMDRSSKQKINKEVLELNDTRDQMDLADVYRIFHPTSAHYPTLHILLRRPWNFPKNDHILGHKAS
jgi:hypothetical protein